MVRRSTLIVAIVVSLVAVACAAGEPVELDEFRTATITIDDRTMDVAVAETQEQRSQGLMGVTDLGGLDGMLFVFQSDSSGGFWMKDTLIPLDIAFFAADGAFVDRFMMEPCTEDPCPSYVPGAPYRYAVEAPAGDLGFVGEASTLSIDG